MKHLNNIHNTVHLFFSISEWTDLLQQRRRTVWAANLYRARYAARTDHVCSFWSVWRGSLDWYRFGKIFE